MSENNNKSGNGTVAEAPDEGVNIRLPEAFVIMSTDGEYNGKATEGKIGLKYGSGKQDWLWMSYMSFKKLIDLAMENREMFNAQLTKEIAKTQVSKL